MTTEYKWLRLPATGNKAKSGASIIRQCKYIAPACPLFSCSRRSAPQTRPYLPRRPQAPPQVPPQVPRIPYSTQPTLTLWFPVMFATKVDTGGYSSGIQERYQAYLITEVPLIISGNRLPPGAYGVGFITNNKFVVMDIGGHDLFVADSQRDEALTRPTPLQVLADHTLKSYRLYGGRSFVVLGRASEPGK